MDRRKCSLALGRGLAVSALPITAATDHGRAVPLAKGGYLPTSSRCAAGPGTPGFEEKWTKMRQSYQK